MKSLFKILLMAYIVMIPDSPLNPKSYMAGDCLSLVVPIFYLEKEPASFANIVRGNVIVTTTPVEVFEKDGESMIKFGIYNYLDPDSKIYDTIPVWLYSEVFNNAHECPRGI